MTATTPARTDARRNRQRLVDTATGEGRAPAPGLDLYPHPFAFSPDNTCVYLTGDRDGHSPVFAVDLATGNLRRLTGPGAYAAPHLSPDGRHIYALRSAYDDPGTVVAVPTDADLDDARAAGLSDDEIWDVGAITALFALSNRMAHLTALRPNSEFFLMGRSR